MVHPLQGEGQRFQSRVVQHGQESGGSLSKTEANLTAKPVWEDLNHGRGLSVQCQGQFPLSDHGLSLPPQSSTHAVGYQAPTASWP